MSSYRKKRRPPGTERTDKQQSLLTETQYSNPGVQRDLSSNQLTSGLPYQRPVEPEDVDRLIAKWDDRLLTPLVVSFRDGKFNVVDGQHRIAAMRKMADGGNVTVPCLIYTGMTYEQEAEMYFKLDQSKGRLRLSHATKALLESGTDAEVLEIKRLWKRLVLCGYWTKKAAMPMKSFRPAQSSTLTGCLAAQLFPACWYFWTVHGTARQSLSALLCFLVWHCF